MQSAVEEATGLLEGRLGDLDTERERVQNALKELKAPTRRTSRPAATPSSNGSKKVTRKRAGGKRAEQAVKLIEKKPGISASEIAKAMKIKPNYLYRVLGDLEKDGRVKKDGRAYSPAK